MFVRSTVAALFVCLLLTSGCGSAEYTGPIQFVDVAGEAGIDFQYTYGDSTYINIMESSGGGITVFDFDGDGDMDLYFLNGTYLEGISTPDGKAPFGGSVDRLYRNDGKGRFTDVTAGSGLDDVNWSMAAAPIDIDGDRDLDLYLMNYGGNRFFRNDGEGRFTDITAGTGLEKPDSLNAFPRWSVGAVVLDFDRDGRLDLFECNFMAFDPAVVAETGPAFMAHPNQFGGQASILFRQDAPGHFTDVTQQHGLLYPDSKCMGAVSYDYDDDGDLDLFQANDHQANFLFRNDGAGRFTETSTAAGVALNDMGNTPGSMHGTIGDVDGDGLTDLLVVDLDHGALYRHRGNGLFEDVSQSSGLAQAFTGVAAWGSALVDYDNDGDLDVFSANGFADAMVLQPASLFDNNGAGHFSNVGPQRGAYFNTRRSGRGSVTVDFDDDGDLDFVVSHVDQPGRVALLRNDGGNRNAWIGFELVGSDGTTISAAGARLIVTASGKRYIRHAQWATSYLSNNDPRVLVGLGTDERVDAVEIVWPDGTRQTVENARSRRYNRIQKQ